MKSSDISYVHIDVRCYTLWFRKSATFIFMTTSANVGRFRNSICCVSMPLRIRLQPWQIHDNCSIEVLRTVNLHRQSIDIAQSTSPVRIENWLTGLIKAQSWVNNLPTTHTMPLWSNPSDENSKIVPDDIFTPDTRFCIQQESIDKFQSSVISILYIYIVEESSRIRVRILVRHHGSSVSFWRTISAMIGLHQ